MTHSTPREFTITFKDIDSNQANQLAAELHGLLQRKVGDAVAVKRHKENPDAQDEGTALIILISTVAMGIHSPETMSEALLTAILVDFAYRHGVELQLEDRLGNAIQIAKDLPISVLDDIKDRIRKFFGKDKDDR